jgi:hypothetical protein
LHHSDKVHFECEVTHSERLPCVDKARSVMSRAHRTLVACCEPASSN